MAEVAELAEVRERSAGSREGLPRGTKVFWITEQLTKPGGGARTCLLRHAVHLAKNGVEQRFAVPQRFWGSGEWDELVELFGVERLVQIKARRWWWPPVRSWIPGSARFRSYQVFKDMLRICDEFEPDALITTNYLSFPNHAARISRKRGIPLSVIVYDYSEEWPEDAAERAALKRRAMALFDAASRIWFVSRELRSAYSNEGLLREISTSRLLWPIPSEASLPKGKLRLPLVAGFAGQIHAKEDAEGIRVCAAGLHAVGGRLLLIIPDGQRQMFEDLEKEFPDVLEFGVWHPSAEGALRLLVERASVLIVPVGFSLKPNAMGVTSFPSKLLEYSRLQMPTVLLADQHAAAMRWARQAGWKCCIDSPDIEAVTALFKHLMHPEAWNEAAEDVSRFARSLFDPHQIHARFESELVIKHDQRGIESHA
jgi:hypothetical protein